MNIETIDRRIPKHHRGLTWEVWENLWRVNPLPVAGGGGGDKVVRSPNGLPAPPPDPGPDPASHCVIRPALHPSASLFRSNSPWSCLMLLMRRSLVTRPLSRHYCEHYTILAWPGMVWSTILWLDRLYTIDYILSTIHYRRPILSTTYTIDYIQDYTTYRTGIHSMYPAYCLSSSHSARRIGRCIWIVEPRRLY